MFKKIILAGFTVLAGLNLLAQTVAVRILSFPATVLPYAPVVISAEVANASGQPLTLAFGYHGFEASCVVMGPDGQPTPPCPELLTIKPAAGYRLETKPANWREIIQRSPSCWPTQPGIYKLAIAVSSAGPYIQADGHQVEAWSGREQSSVVSIEIKAPNGVDAEALRAFQGDPLGHPEDLLKRFPTSTYAGYALTKMGPGGYLAGSESWGTMNPRQRDIAWAVPLGASGDKQEARRQQIRQGLQSFLDQARAFLALHPDFAGVDVLRKEMANALFQLDRRDEAMVEVQKLSKMKGPFAGEAQALLKKSGPSSIKP